MKEINQIQLGRFRITKLNVKQIGRFTTITESQSDDEDSGDEVKEESLYYEIEDPLELGYREQKNTITLEDELVEDYSVEKYLKFPQTTLVPYQVMFNLVRGVVSIYLPMIVIPEDAELAGESVLTCNV